MLRRLTPADAEAFSALRLLGLQQHPEAFATNADAWRTASPEQRATSLQPGREPTDRFVLGSFVDGALVGIVGFRREGRPVVRHKASLWGLVVHPDHRRCGIGTSLVTAAIDHARTCEGLRYLRVVATVQGDAAIGLAASLGFARYGLEQGGLVCAGVAFDQAFMRFDLS